MESTLKDILERRSSRKYRPDQISEDELYRVLEAGMYAPSAMNRQSSVMVVLQDRDEIAHLSRMNASIMGSDGDPFYGRMPLASAHAGSTGRMRNSRARRARPC